MLRLCYLNVITVQILDFKTHGAKKIIAKHKGIGMAKRDTRPKEQNYMRREDLITILK